jgi:uncharacterized membrane protein
MKLARLHRLAKDEPFWHVQLAVLVAIALQLVLNNKLTIGSKYLIAGFEFLLVLALTVFGTKQNKFIQHIRRTMAIALIIIISIANIASLVLVVKELLGGKQFSGRQLIISALAIYLTNIIIFGLLYWELDNGASQKGSGFSEVDFLFPQMTSSDELPYLLNWYPTFLDYLYLSLTNASAFSPTDTMPLTHRAKSLMGLQSTVSFITVALLAARAVNILS